MKLFNYKNNNKMKKILFIMMPLLFVGVLLSSFGCSLSNGTPNDEPLEGVYYLEEGGKPIFKIERNSEKDKYGVRNYILYLYDKKTNKYSSYSRGENFKCKIPEKINPDNHGQKERWGDDFTNFLQAEFKTSRGSYIIAKTNKNAKINWNTTYVETAIKGRDKRQGEIISKTGFLLRQMEYKDGKSYVDVKVLYRKDLPK